jgi:hypothetical protein
MILLGRNSYIGKKRGEGVHEVRTLAIILMCVLGTTAPSPAMGSRDNEDVRLTVRLSAEVLRPGQTADILITFTPAEDIHIVASPAVQLNIRSTRTIALSGAVRQMVDTQTGFLSTQSAVTRRFAVAKRARPGTYTVQGSVVYYYCSESEGWCRKFVQPVEISFTISG